MKIEFYEKFVYGNQQFYVADPDIASKIKKITGYHTITKEMMDRISDLFGVEFTQVIRPL